MLSLLAACATATAAPGAPAGVVLAEAVLHSGPGPDTPQVGTLPEDTVVEVVARSTERHESPLRDGLGHPMLLVQAGDRTGWVHGEHVAVEVRWDHASGWGGEAFGRRRLGETTVWAAGRDGREWSDTLEAWDRPVHEGWLVLQRDAGLRRVPWSESNGWGSSRSADRLVWRDVTGDGVSDLVTVVQETVTEAGNMGQTVELWDFTRPTAQPLVSIPVHDPHWSGLATESAWGFVDVDVAAGRFEVRQHAVETHACAAGTCLRLAHQTWRWTGTGVATGPRTSGPLEVAVAAGPLLASPEGPAVGAHPGGRACVGAVRGPIGIGDVFAAHVEPCGGRPGPEGWVASDRLTPDLPLIAEILGPWPDPPSTYVRFPWDRE